MKSGIPSLNSLIIFEKAASARCFKTAAESLFITAPAVSHQIRALENDLGVQLFKRLNRAIELTEAGELYYKKISPALTQIRNATKQVSAPSYKPTFRINCIPFIANSLLIPNIHRFMHQHADLNVDIKSLPTGEGLESGSVALEIRLHHDENPALHYEKLISIEASPICSKTYLEQHHDIRTKLSGHRLIKLPAKTDIWDLWSRQFSVDMRQSDEVLVGNYQGILAAITANMGIAMGYFSQTLNLYNDQIVALFPEYRFKLGNLYLVYLKENAQKPEFIDFKNWLLALCQGDVSEAEASEP